MSNEKTINNEQKANRAEPVIVEAETGEQEVEMVVRKIHELLAEKKYTYKDNNSWNQINSTKYIACKNE